MKNKLDNLTPRSFKSLGATKVTRIPIVIHNDILSIISELDRIHSDNPDKMEKVLDNLITTLGDL